MATFLYIFKKLTGKIELTTLFECSNNISIIKIHPIKIKYRFEQDRVLDLNLY